MEIIRIGQLEVKFLLSKDDTGGSMDMFEVTVPPAARVPMPHYHRDYDEAVYGLSGTTTFMVDGKRIEVSAGDHLFIRRGAVHHFTNAHDVTARALAILTPGLIGPAFFRDMAALVNAGGPPDKAKMAETMLRYGLVPAPDAI